MGACRGKGQKPQEHDVSRPASTDKRKGNHTRQRPKQMKIAGPPCQGSSPQISNTAYSSGRLVCFCLRGEPNCSWPGGPFRLRALEGLVPNLWSGLCAASGPAFCRLSAPRVLFEGSTLFSLRTRFRVCCVAIHFASLRAVIESFWPKRSEDTFENKKAYHTEEHRGKNIGECYT